jgi:hypothetical protein
MMLDNFPAKKKKVLYFIFEETLLTPIKFKNLHKI